MILKTAKRRRQKLLDFIIKLNLVLTSLMKLFENIRCRRLQKDDLCMQFYNILDLAAINAWIIYKEFTGETNISRQGFIQLLANELRQTYTYAKNKARKSLTDPSSETRSQKRRKCEVKLYKGNMNFNDCITCKKMVSGKCFAKTVYTCKTCIPNNVFEKILFVFGLEIFSNFLKMCI